MAERNSRSDVLPDEVERALAAVARAEPSPGFTRAVMARLRPEAALRPSPWAGWRLAAAAGALVTLVSAGLLWRADHGDGPAPTAEQASAGRGSPGIAPSGPARPVVAEAVAGIADRAPGLAIPRAVARPRPESRIQQVPDALHVPALPGPEPIEIGDIEFESLLPDALTIPLLVVPAIDVDDELRLQERR